MHEYKHKLFMDCFFVKHRNLLRTAFEKNCNQTGFYFDTKKRQQSTT